jgi:EAL domain-containing protein (putative c-di-GMP-specific phosphodiesterase class I)
VLQQAASQSVRWRAQGIGLSIAVNLPALALSDELLPNRLATLLHEHDLPGAALEIEITEEALLVDPSGAQTVLEGLRLLGVHTSIDDYGTGYSSLAYLRQLVVDELKIDRSFIVAMRLDDRSSSIVRSTIDLAHALGLRVVAEGVEDAEIADLLRSFGCDAAQGYYWSRPLPAANFDAWLSDYSTATGIKAAV